MSLKEVGNDSPTLYPSFTSSLLRIALSRLGEKKPALRFQNASWENVHCLAYLYLISLLHIRLRRRSKFSCGCVTLTREVLIRDLIKINLYCCMSGH